MKLLLASKSETRRRMLEQAGVPFAIVSAPLDEEIAKEGLIAAGFTPRDLAEMLAELKAKSVEGAGEDLVLGADQTLESDGELLSKPGDRETLRAQLLALAGRTHWLHSAAVLIGGGERIWGRTETVAMKMRELSSDFVDDYLDREFETVRWNVGGYRIEGLGAQLFDEIEGSHFAVLGLPLLPLLAALRERGLMPR